MAVLGLRNTRTYGDAGFRFENYRRTILYAFPNGSAPLVAVLSLLEDESTNDTRFHWYDKSLPAGRAALVANYTNVATSFQIATAEFRVGQLVRNETTLEIMLITSVTGTGPYTYGVHRGEWTVAATAGTAGEFMMLQGNAVKEGAGTPCSMSRNPRQLSNYTEIFRTSVQNTGSALKTSLKYDKTGPSKEDKREKLQDHSIDEEWAFIQGEPAEFYVPGDTEPTRTTGGVIWFLSQYAPQNIVNVDVDGGGFMSETLMDHYLERAFRTCSNRANEKLMLCGSGALSVINTAAKMGSQLNLVPDAESFGISLMRWITPHGSVLIKSHPLFTHHPLWRYNALILDVGNLKYRYLTDRDTRYLTNRQAPGEDRRVDEFLTEAGLEVQIPESHFLIRNIRCYTNSIYCPDTGVGGEDIAGIQL